MEVKLDELDGVTGGTDTGANCWFEPQVPTVITGEGDRRRVRCKSTCNARCSCHGTNYCIDRMHLIENTAPEARELWPAPRGRNNHSENRKRILVN